MEFEVIPLRELRPAWPSNSLTFSIDSNFEFLDGKGIAQHVQKAA